MIFSRQPVEELEGVMVVPGEETGAPGAPEVSDDLVEKLRNSTVSKDLLTEKATAEKAVYVVNRSGKDDSVITAEIRLGR